MVNDQEVFDEQIHNSVDVDILNKINAFYP
jgi:hypothetical protein